MLSHLEIKDFTNGMQESLRTKAKAAILAAITDTLGEGDIVFLSALGLDAKVLMLDIFISECTTLKGELCQDQEHQKNS